MTRIERLQAYERQIERLDRRIAHFRGRSRRFSWLRLGILIGGILVAYALFYFVGDLAGWIASVLLAALFIAVAMIHQRVEQGIRRHTIWRELKLLHVARMKLDWDAIPRSGAIPPDDEHPFEIDLDLSGPSSLHHLIDAAVTLEGSRRLRDWLAHGPPDLDVVARRQAIVRELMPMTIFRDKLALLTRLASKGPGAQWQAQELLHWLGHGSSVASARASFLIGLALSTTAIVLAALHFALDVETYWIPALALYVIFLATRRKLTQETLDDSLSLELALSKFAAAFRYLERYRYGRNRHLRELCAPFIDSADPPSRAFHRVSRIVSWASFKNNPLLWGLMNLLFPLTLYLAYSLGRSKEVLKKSLPAWLDIWFELEALSSLAGFGWLNPRYSFPEITMKRITGEPIFVAQGLGHPLIPEERKSRNDFRFDETGEIMLITGSNMAGKSTFLRTLGINLVLAYAGAPVDADALHAILFRLYTSIRINDSLSDGFSFFYAEVRRLRGLLDQLEREDPHPLFFLIDEIFRGTNNRERLIGSRSYIRALAGRNGVGAIATHDLELVHLAEEIPSITNRHFREEVIDGTMIFDYKLREGPCPTTNALLIMKMAGLPVEDF